MDSITLHFIRFPAGVSPFSLAEERRRAPFSPLISKSAGEPPSVAGFAALQLLKRYPCLQQASSKLAVCSYGESGRQLEETF
jgi:hypothetical protein